MNAQLSFLSSPPHLFTTSFDDEADIIDRVSVARDGSIDTIDHL
jgi:hypothetical protein